MVIWQARRNARPEPGPGAGDVTSGRVLFDRAVALGRDDPAATAAAYQLVIDCCGDDPGQRELVAAALFNQAAAVLGSGQPADALPAIDRAVAIYRELDHGPQLQQALGLQAEARATALFNEAVALGRDPRPESAEIAAMVYAEVVRRYGHEPALANLTAKARFNRAQLLGGLRRDAEAAAAFGELAEVAGTEPGLREMAAKARYSQAVMLRRRCRTSEAQAAIGQAVSLYAELVAAEPDRYRGAMDRAEEIAAQLNGSTWADAVADDASWTGAAWG